MSHAAPSLDELLAKNPEARSEYDRRVAQAAGEAAAVVTTRAEQAEFVFTQQTDSYAGPFID